MKRQSIDADQASALAFRVRTALQKLGAGVLAEKPMFGVRAFLLQGNMLCYVSARGLTLRVGKDAAAEAAAKGLARACAMSGRSMPAYVVVDAEAVKEDAQLEKWIRSARMHVESLKPKKVVAR